eukprot:Opistho-2@42620
MADKRIAITVNLMNETEKEFFFDTGKRTTAYAVHTAVCDALQLKAESRNLFSLWIVGSRLQLQFKNYHEPFVVRTKWAELTQRYLGMDSEEEPLIIFRRDALLTKAAERKLRDPLAVMLLYEEARYNVLEGNYPCTNEDAYYLAAIILQLQNGEYNPHIHTFQFLEERLLFVLPPHMLSNLRATDWCDRIAKAYLKLQGKRDPEVLHRLFLQYTWQWPFYGATFFYGELPPNTALILRDRMNTIVRVAVSAEGVTVINEGSNKILHSFVYDDIAWDLTETEDAGMLVIEYGPEASPQELQILSLQARLMDTIIERCVDILNSKDAEIAHIREQQK